MHIFWKSVEAGAKKAGKELDVEIIWKGPMREDDREDQIKVVDDMITIRPRMFVSLGYDHRLIDGATAERFLSSIKSKLENFDENAL